LNAESSPIVSYWHVWSDADGVSHQTRCQLTEFQKAAIQPTAAPQWIGTKTRLDTTVFVTVLPAGWIGDWHENPQPQWIVPLSGRWYVETMDGIKFFLDNPDCAGKPNAAETWLLLRASGTEPLLRVYCESCSVESVTKILEAAQKFVLQGSAV